MNSLHEEVKTWFTAEALEQVLGKPQGQTEEIGREWLARAGKRWRPFLTVAAYQALRDNPEGELSDSLKKAAIAVECFHKASLIHDDIEDNDTERYDEPTLHEEHGVPVALNVGDLLIGEGYRLLADNDLSSTIRAAALKVAAEGQRELCRGQGAELLWNNNPVALSNTQVLEIFRSKTAPAFEVALKVGAALAGRLDDVEDALHQYSEALGIAYQIRDDLDDLGDDRRHQRHRRAAPEPPARHGARAGEVRKAKLPCALGTSPAEGATVARSRAALPRARRPTSAAATCSNATRRKPSAACAISKTRASRDCSAASSGRFSTTRRSRAGARNSRQRISSNVTGTEASLEKSGPRVVATV